MDFGELSSALSPRDGALLVGGSANALRSDSINHLAGDFFGGAFQLLVDEKAEAKYEGKEAIRVKGRLASDAKFLGRSGWEAEAWFFVEDGGAEAVFLLKPGQSGTWKRWWSASAKPAETLDDVDFRDCVFTLDSRLPDALDKSFDELFDVPATRSDARARKRGLRLASKLELSSFDETLGEFLGFTDAQSLVPVTGTVELVDDMPRMRLAAAIGPRLQFGKLDVQLSYEFLTAPIPVDSAKTLQQIRERLRATLTYEHGDNIVTIPLAATFEPNEIVHDITIEGRPIVRNQGGLDQKAGLSLSDLTGLIPGDIGQITQQLDAFPEVKNALSAVRLTEFGVGVASEPLAITEAYAQLEIELNWEIIKDLISFKKVALELFATGDEDGWDLRPYLTAELAIADGKLSAMVDPLAPSFSLVLEEGSSIDLKKLLAIDTLGLPPSPLTDTGDKFDITWFEISGDPVKKSYSLDIATTFDWGFDLGATRLAVKQLFLSLEYTEGKSFVGLGGSLAIGDVTSTIGARYDSSNWIISASAYDIRLNDILDLVPNVEQLRPVLPEIELPFVGFEVTPSTKEFKFDAECRINWSSQPLGIDGNFRGDIALRLARAANAPLTYDIRLLGTGQLADPALGATLDVHIRKPDEKGQQVTVRGTLAVKNLTDLLPDGSMFPAVQLESAVGFEYETRTSALSFTLDQKIVIPAVKEALKQDIELGFAFCRIGNQKGEGEGAKSRILAGAVLKTPIRLAAIAGDNAVGQLLGGMEIRNLGIFYATDDVSGELPPSLQKLFDGARSAGLEKGPSFTANFVLGGSSADIGLSQSPTPIDAGAPSAVAPTVPSPGRGVVPESARDGRLRKWFNVNKAFGPLEIRRIGAEWDNPILSFLLDASVELMGLKVGLAGLRLGVPPAKLTELRPNDITVGLDGLEIAFKGGPISISGAFLRKPDGGFAGTALIRAEMFTIAAMGAYDQIEGGDPSLFIYGAYIGAIGGPPCFVVQGLAAGFGYNRGLTVPSVEGVHKFPLVSLVMSSAGGSASPGAGSGSGDSTSVLEQLSGDDFPVAPGQYWLAAGVKFTSFKLIDAFALLTVQFGVRFELALLGVATVQQPPKVEGPGTPVKPFVLVELALSVRFAPDDGLFSARAVLTSNSYLFDPQCKLTGGFAFCIWFEPTDPKFRPGHAGDFVLTLGGYHPRFQVPDHYPRVPRVGFNWQRPDLGVTIKGESYFALTPSCMMAGCRLSAIYASSDFKAWFEASADFLMAWAPFHYEADIGVWIGASYTARVGEITSVISFQIGASLSIWGPEFAGIAYVDLGIAAFTVHIGAETARTPEAIKWEQFCGRFIPHVDKNPAPLGITVTGGLLREDKKEGQKEGQIFVNPSELGLSIETYIPVTNVLFNGKPLDYRGKQKDGKPIETSFGIRPLAATAIKSELTVWFTRDAQDTADGVTRERRREVLSESRMREIRMSGAHPLEIDAITKGLPEALWSPKPAPSEAEPIKANVIGNALSGVRLFVGQERTPTYAEVDPRIRDESRATTRHPPLRLERAGPGEQKSASEFGEMLRKHAGQRRQTVAALRTFEFDLMPGAIDLEQLADYTGQQDFLAATPAVVALGQLPPMRRGQ
jgi:hypothetical protein